LKSTTEQKCEFCELPADRYCPIAGKEICSTTCLEISLWADQVEKQGDDLYLEYIDKICFYCKQHFKMNNEKKIANKCIDCEYHWINSE